MSMRHLLSGLVLVLAAAGIAGCNSSSDTQMRVNMTDGPVLGFSQVTLVVTQVSAHRAGATNDEANFVVLSNSAMTVPLLDLQNGVFLTVAASQVPAGRYDGIRLRIGEGSTITLVGGAIFALQLSSGANTWVILTTPAGNEIVVNKGEKVDVDLDFDMSHSNFALVNGRYHMTPVIHVMPRRFAAGITGTLLPVGIEGQVIATMQGRPSETRTAFVSAVGAQAGRFRLSVLGSGTYDLTIRPSTVGFRETTVTGVQVSAGQITNVGAITVASITTAATGSLH